MLKFLNRLTKNVYAGPDLNGRKGKSDEIAMNDVYAGPDMWDDEEIDNSDGSLPTYPKQFERDREDKAMMKLVYAAPPRMMDDERKKE